MSMSLQGFKSEAGKFLTPIKALGDIWIGTTEKVVELQMGSCKAYSDIAFGQLRKVPDIHSLEEAGDFFWGQIEPLSEFNKQVLSDWKALISINTELSGNIKLAFSTRKAEPVTSVLAPEKEEKAEPVTKITRAKRAPRAKKASASE